MGFSVKIFPGVRVRASSRGLSAGIGPRAARVHVGTRGVGVSSGLGPFSAYTHLGGGTRRRSSGGGNRSGGTRSAGGGGYYSRSSLQAYKRAVRQAEKAQEIERVAELEQRLVSLHCHSFASPRRQVLPAPAPVDPAPLRARLDAEMGVNALVDKLGDADQPPLAAPAQPVDRDGLRDEERERALADVGVFKRRERREARARADEQAERRAAEQEREREQARQTEQARLDDLWREVTERRAQVQARLDQLMTEEQERREAARAAEQAQLDEAWERLVGNDPQTVMATLEEAFADNEAPAAPIDCHDSRGSVAMTFGHPDLVPERTPALTPAGKPTLRKRTKGDRNALYLASLASNVLATVREALAVATGIQTVSVLVVRRERPAGSPEVLAAVYAGNFQRERLARAQWSRLDPTDELLAADDVLVNFKGQAREVAPLDLRDEPEAQAVLTHIAEALAVPALQPRQTRSATHRADRVGTPDAAGSSPADRRSAGSRDDVTQPAERQETDGVRGRSQTTTPAATLDHPDPDVRSEAVSALRQRPDVGAFDSLVRLAGDPDR